MNFSFPPFPPPAGASRTVPDDLPVTFFLKSGDGVEIYIPYVSISHVRVKGSVLTIVTLSGKEYKMDLKEASTANAQRDDIISNKLKFLLRC